MKIFPQLRLIDLLLSKCKIQTSLKYFNFIIKKNAATKVKDCVWAKVSSSRWFSPIFLLFSFWSFSTISKSSPCMEKNSDSTFNETFEEALPELELLTGTGLPLKSQLQGSINWCTLGYGLWSLNSILHKKRSSAKVLE